MARPVSNPLALAVLSCLWERPMYPYEITTTLRERGKETSIRINFGSLYAVIKSLEKHGLIEAARVEKEGNRPERIVYAITPAGRVEADSWLRELIEVPQKEYPAFESGLSLIGILPPNDALELLRKRVGHLDELIRVQEEELSGPLSQVVPEIFLIESEYSLEMARAERRWVARLAERFGAGEIQGQQFATRMHEILAAGRNPREFADELRASFPEMAEVIDALGRNESGLPATARQAEERQAEERPTAAGPAADAQVAKEGGAPPHEN